MNIILNGEKKQVPDGVTIAGLLEFLNIQHQRVAVEMNEAIVKKDRYFDAVVSEGDSLEVVSFMGGGQALSVDFALSSKQEKRDLRHDQR